MIRPVAFYTLAAVVPLVALWLAAPASRSAHGMAVAPFGWPSLLVVQCLAAVPLAAVAAGSLVKRVKWRSPIPAVAAGVVLAVGGYFAVPAVAGSLDSTADFTLRSLARSAVCLLLAVPWAVAARVGSPPVGGSRVTVVIGLVAGFVLPGVWAHKLAKENTAAAQDELAARRMARAFPLIDGVCDLDPARQIVEADGNLTMPAARKRLTADLKGFAADLARADPQRLKSSDKLLYAEALVSLDRTAEAEPILRELVRTSPQATLPLARVLHLQQRYAESDAVARDQLAAGLPVVDTNPSVRKACLDAYDLLAENATKRGSNADRERVLKDGLEKMPGERAYFHFQLGRHYNLTGRPLDAVKELSEAARLDNSYGPRAEAMTREIREHTPACLIGR